MELDRATFGDRQAEMTARWYENVKRQHGDVDAYIRTRHNAYLDRWREAGRFIEDGADVLDIGGGNLFKRLVEYLRDRGFKYSYLDIDPAAVDGSRALADSVGLKGASFAQGFNDQLNFPDNSFDAVFSSHCVEHSIDLSKTFRELNRVIRDGGNLMISIPFGWEENPEHPYFLGPDEWISLVEDAGFDVRVAQIGNEYPEYGEDYFIAARKRRAASESTRVIPDRYRKEQYTFVGLDDDSITYLGEFDRREGEVISRDQASVISIVVPAGTTEILPIFRRHSWSGVVEVTASSSSREFDLYSWFSYDMPARIPLEDRITSEAIKIKLNGRRDVSRWGQYVFKGYMFA